MKNIEDYFAVCTLQPIPGIATYTAIKADITLLLPHFLKDYKEEHPASTDVEATRILWKLVDKWKEDKQVALLNCTIKFLTESEEEFKKTLTKSTSTVDYQC